MKDTSSPGVSASRGTSTSDNPGAKWQSVGAPVGLVVLEPVPFQAPVDLVVLEPLPVGWEVWSTAVHGGIGEGRVG